DVCLVDDAQYRRAKSVREQDDRDRREQLSHSALLSSPTTRFVPEAAMELARVPAAPLEFRSRRTLEFAEEAQAAAKRAGPVDPARTGVADHAHLRRIVDPAPAVGTIATGRGVLFAGKEVRRVRTVADEDHWPRPQGTERDLGHVIPCAF